MDAGLLAMHGAADEAMSAQAAWALMHSKCLHMATALPMRCLHAVTSSVHSPSSSLSATAALLLLLLLSVV